MKLLTLSLIASFFIGCSHQYIEVYKAVRCDVGMPPKPKQKDDRIETIKEILIYTEELEKRLKVCIGEENE